MDPSNEVTESSLNLEFGVQYRMKNLAIQLSNVFRVIVQYQTNDDDFISLYKFDTPILQVIGDIEKRMERNKWVLVTNDILYITSGKYLWTLYGLTIQEKDMIKNKYPYWNNEKDSKPDIQYRFITEYT
jgi:hypothetical protein